MQKILKFSEKKIKNVNLDFKRYLYEDILKIQNTNLITGIVWLRWIWKTTLLLQIAKERELEWKKWIYFSCDYSFIYWKTIFDIIEYFYENYDIKYFYIDEIHKQKNWEQSLKTAYDIYDDIKIIFSGSSSIDLIKWTYDLSRRAILRKLNKFSFREYLKFVENVDIEVLNIDKILENSVKLSYEIFQKNNNLLKYYKNYIKYWELGFVKSLKKEDFDIENFEEIIWNIVNKIIYEDISSYYNISSTNLSLFFKILKFSINSSASILNYSSIAKQINTTSDTVKYYIEILQEIWLVHLIWKEWKISVNLRKSKKILFELSSIINLFSEDLYEKANIWLIRESLLVSDLKKVWEIYYSEKGDYLFIHKNKKYFLEIWWKNKTYKQLKWIENWFIIKDDILFSENKNEIPLWMFWLLY